MSTFQRSLAGVRPRAFLVYGVAIAGWAGALSAAPFEPDPNTLALYHFDSETADRRTPDSGPFGIDGQLEGDVLPTRTAALPSGYGFAYTFDGLDRGAGNSRINMGTDSRVGLRGKLSWTLDVVVSVPAPLADDGYYRGVVCRAGPAGVDYSLSYVSWTNPTYGPEHEFWFTTAVGNAGNPPDYAYAVSTYSGYMEVGQTYAVRVTVTNGAMAITVNGAPGNGPPAPTQAGMVVPPTPGMAAELTVGDTCPEDHVAKPSELQIDELRISDVSRTDIDDLLAGITQLVAPATTPTSTAPTSKPKLGLPLR
jgi:hypothetical protein